MLLSSVGVEWFHSGLDDHSQAMLNLHITALRRHLVLLEACLLFLTALLVLLPYNVVSDASSPRNRLIPPAKGQFVFADFDGDQKPDLALVEMGSLRSPRTNYSIRLRFSAREESSIGVDGPLGGLQVAARDVNGDDILDLVVTSNLDAQFIEVLLNDGHGNFTVADPGQYADTEQEAAAFLATPANVIVDNATLATGRFSFSDIYVGRWVFGSAAASGHHGLFGNSTMVQAERLSRQGRSPPALLAIS